MEVLVMVVGDQCYAMRRDISRNLTKVRMIYICKMSHSIELETWYDHRMRFKTEQLGLVL